MSNRCLKGDGFFCSIELRNDKVIAILRQAQDKLQQDERSVPTDDAMKNKSSYKPDKKLYFYTVEQVKRFRIPIF